MSVPKNQAISLDLDILIDPDQAGKLLGVPATTLSKWRCTGEYSLPYVKVGRHVRYRTTDIKKWIEKRTFNAPPSKRAK